MTKSQFPLKSHHLPKMAVLPKWVNSIF